MFKFFKILILFVTLFCTPTCFAAGWNDFALDIGDDYTIYKCNSLDIVLAKDTMVILGPSDFDNLGPISMYSVTKEYVFTKNLGRKPRNLFEGDQFEEIDSSKEFYFIITKKAGQVMGPFSEAEFQNHSLIKMNSPIKWKKPKNPNVFLPLLGASITLGFLVIHYFWITIPLLILIILLLYKLITRKRIVRFSKNLDGDLGSQKMNKKNSIKKLN